MSIPTNLKYGGKIEGAPSRTSRLNLAPQNGTGPYGLGDTIAFNFPCRPNLLMNCMDSYFKFNLSVTNADGAANTYRFDSNGAHGLIRQIRIWSGSNLLSDIDSYSTLSKLLFDLQVPTSVSYGKFNGLAGTRSDQVVTATGGGAIASTGTTGGAAGTVNGTAVTAMGAATNVELANILNTLTVSQINTGDIHASAVAQNTASTSQTYCLNLITLLGSLCQNQYFPLFECMNSTLKMEITLNDTINKIFGCIQTGAGTIAVSNCEYVCNMIELGDQSMAMVRDALQGQPLQFVVSDWRSFQTAVQVSSGALINIPIAAKFASLKSLFLTSRDRYMTSTYYPQSSVTCGLQSYYFRVGATIMPPKAPSTYPEMFAEVIKAIASMGDLTHMPAIDKNSYQQASSFVQTSASITNGTTSSGSFYVGIDLEAYPNSQKSGVYAGWNANSDDIFCSLQYGTVPTASVVQGQTYASIRYDIFANFDTLLVFENGIAYARF